MRNRHGLLLLVISSSASGIACGESLSEVLFETGIKHIAEHGPDIESERFIDYTGPHAWRRRNEVISLLAPFLKSDDPKAVAGSLRAIHGLRGVAARGAVTVADDVLDRFCEEVDEIGYKYLDHYFDLEDDSVLKALALHCTWPHSSTAKTTLLRIIHTPHAKNAKSQALICLGWWGDPDDMEMLCSFMLEDSPESSTLPSLFKNSYGEATPYLERALTNAAWAGTRLEAAFELVHLREPAGLEHLLAALKEDPEPVGLRTRPAKRVMLFARDRLELPKDQVSPEGVAAHLAQKLQELNREASD